MAMGRVDDQQIDSRINQPFGAFKSIVANTCCGGNAQTALSVLRGIRVELRFLDILDGDEANTIALSVDDEKLFDAVLMQQPFRFLLLDALLDGNQPFASHQFGDLLRRVRTRSERRGWSRYR